MADERAWSSSMNDPVGQALRARQDVWSRLPWWWPRGRRQMVMSAIEVYVRTVLIAFHREQIQGWPPSADGTPTVDQALQPRRRLVRRTQTGRFAPPAKPEAP